MRRKILVTFLATLSAILNLSAQSKTERTDSLVRLMSAQQMELVERNGASYRKVTGPARFLHNNTYLICDTAWWHVDLQQIEAIGNVRILQEQTVLTGDKLTYYIDRDLAEFRGTLVQLQDKDKNTLRTRHMDYNTRDSIAVFENGGSMKDKDGQVIESRTGTYDSKIKLFTFTEDVNMFTDSIFVKTTRLTYDTDRNYATFGVGTNAWKEDDMLSSDAGWYDRNRELFFFRDKVHGMTPDQEVWADSLYFWRLTNDVEMSGRTQLTDTTRNVFALAGHMHYIDSIAQITLTRDPAVVGLTGEAGEPKDTVWFGADKMVYQTFPMCDIPEGTVKAAEKRLEDLDQDAVMAYRRKAAEEAEKARQEAMKDDPNNPDAAAQRRTGAAGKTKGGPDTDIPGDQPEPLSETSLPPETKEPTEPEETPQSPPESVSSLDGTEAPDLSEEEDPMTLTDKQPSDSLSLPADSLAASRHELPDSLGVDFPSDSLSSPADSLALGLEGELAGPVDSTKVGFLTAYGRARLFREDIQLRADSLAYNDLDSLVRLYKDPVVWNEGNRQYSADSLYLVIKDRRMEKASLMANAFIIIEEEPGRCYDQIRSVEMLAYFDESGGLRRFDALGDANAVFYLKEDSTFATVNLSQAKMLYVQFLNGEIDRVSYFDQIKNNAYPLAQMTKDDQTLKGFNWRPEQRPVSKEDITPLTLRESQRAMYEARPRTKFVQTDIYYPGYMSGVYKRLKEREEEKARRQREKAALEQAKKDSLAAADSLGTDLADSLAMDPSDSLALADSLNTTLRDSLAVQADSLGAATDPAMTGRDSVVTEAPLDAKALKKAEREAAAKAKAAARAAKLAKKEARWAELDSLDAVKLRLKEEKKAERLRQKKLKALQAAEKQARKDQEKLEKYIRRYEKKKAKEEERLAKKNSKKAKKTAGEAESESTPASHAAEGTEKQAEEPSGGVLSGEREAEPVPSMQRISVRTL